MGGADIEVKRAVGPDDNTDGHRGTGNDVSGSGVELLYRFEPHVSLRSGCMLYGLGRM